MSWREILGVVPETEIPYAQNSHNAQNPAEVGNCADIADSAYRDSSEEQSKLLEAVSGACAELDITLSEVLDSLAEEDVEDWRNGLIDGDTLAVFARSLAQRREMKQGKRPDHYTEQAVCKQCGPIWLWLSGEVLGCPWCWNRVAGKPIPRPEAVHCRDCAHFERIDHPHLGHCKEGQPEAVAGIWDTDSRMCEFWVKGKSYIEGRDDV